MAAFLDVLADYPCQASPEEHRVPFRALLPLPELSRQRSVVAMESFIGPCRQCAWVPFLQSRSVLRSSWSLSVLLLVFESLQHPGGKATSSCDGPWPVKTRGCGKNADQGPTAGRLAEAAGGRLAGPSGSSWDPRAYIRPCELTVPGKGERVRVKARCTRQPGEMERHARIGARRGQRLNGD